LACGQVEDTFTHTDLIILELFMARESFNATVQYNDHLGTVAADDSDDGTFHSLLLGKGLIQEGEYIAGIEAFTSDSFMNTGEQIWVGALIDSEENSDFKKVRVNLSLEEFFSCFKRLEFKISPSGSLTGKTIDIHE
jgi:hypothetical protein